MLTPSYKIRDRWLSAALPLITEHGWHQSVLDQAAKHAGLTPGECALALPGGVNQLIDHMFEAADTLAMNGIDTSTLSNLRTHQKVAKVIEMWLSALEPHKSAVAHAAGRGLTPWGASAAGQRTWKTADLIWTLAGDSATDYNRETKRALLSSVLPDIILFWTQTDNEDELANRIETRLSQAMSLGKFGSKLLGPLLERLSKTQTN